MHTKLFFIIVVLLLTNQVQPQKYVSGPCVNNKNELVGQKALNNALLQAIAHRDWRLAKELLEEGADANARTDEYYSNSALEEAIMSKDTVIVKLLIKHGADTRTPNRFGDSPLLTALLFSSPEIIKLILDTNPEMCVVNKRGLDAYDIALIRNEKQVIDWISQATQQALS
jgi:ankyrin repeat protein